MKIVKILRGPSGSGKTTLAKQLIKKANNPIICSADDFFVQDGVYNFDHRLLGLAHSWCRGKFAAALELGADVIVIDNTNTRLKEFEPYLDGAKDAGYETDVITVGGLDESSLKNYANRNRHKVSIDLIRKQAARIAANKYEASS